MKILKRVVILLVVAALLYSPVYFSKRYAVSLVTNGHPENYKDVGVELEWYQFMPQWAVTVTYENGRKHSTMVDAIFGTYTAG